tara:strand:+ start:3762 stop:4076 length:315 start_codon:yes stop_codon:yes gene_type:complete
MTDKEKQAAVTEQVKNLLATLESDDVGKVLVSCLNEWDFGVVTQWSATLRNDMLCSPIIWVADDLETVSIEQWDDVGGQKVLKDRSIELGQEVRQDIESWWTTK